MPAILTLDIATEPAARRVVLRLSQAGGPFLAAREVDLTRHAAADWHGVFDTRRHVRSLEGVVTPGERLAALGRFLGEHVLGTDIARALADGVDHRTLLVRVPADPEDKLAAAFARVPWEIARAPGDDRTLASRNVVARVALEGAEPARETSIVVGPSEPVRVLLVFAEAPGQRPLAARQERERLLALFFDEVMPARNVEVDVLCHGVTRRRLEAQVQARGGYHVVHWSGHGDVNALEIGLDAGEEARKVAPRITGEELVRIFVSAGGFIPPVVFLGACQSGSMVSVKDWASLRASLGEDGGVRGGGDPTLDRVLEAQPGFAGTALALVRAGVKQVVAMRYEVGDTYARRLATRVYRGMFADRAHHAVDAAVALARGALVREERRAGEYNAVDHATPLVFGREPVRLVPGSKPSAQRERRAPRPQPLLPSGSRELDAPRGFVGRGEELTRLQREWLETAERPVALIQGLAGLGKTSLAAEAVHLWFGRFDYVLAFQARGGALGVEEFYRRLDQRLALASKTYRARCQENELARVYLAPGTEGLAGAEREEALRNNLIDALAYERALVVLDNFETNLLTKAGVDGAYACADPAWERLLAALANRLRGTPSRVVVTSRHKIAALEGKALLVPLGPLPMGEAALFFQGHPALRELWYGDDAAKAVAKRILYVSRGHPLILGRIADLAGAYEDKVYGLTPAGRQAIDAALDTIQGNGYKSLPDLFAGVRSDKDREQERVYLEDVAVGAVDLLIERLGVEARTLLWVVTRAGEPVAEDMIGAVWGAAPALLLGELCGTGLLMREGEGTYAFHELVAQRAAEWMEQHPGERGGRTEAEVWKAYGEWYGAAFETLLSEAKRDLAFDAGRTGIRYLVRARAFEHLGVFASTVIAGTRDPALLEQVTSDLRAVAGEVPVGRERWRLRLSLAAALCNAGRPDQALSLCAQAAEEAEAARHWSDLGAIYGNWAIALFIVGQLELAREAHFKSAEAKRRAGRPRVDIVGSELEALRVEVKQGGAERALPAIERTLGEVRAWWAMRQQGKPVPEAPNDEVLGRTLLGGLDIARGANDALERWQSCLDLLGELEKVQRERGTGEHDVVGTRFNRYGPLMRLGERVEAKAVLEGCLDVFHRAEDVTREARTLGALAHLWSELGDPAQTIAIARRALALQERLPNPGDRAISHNNLALYLHVANATGEAKAHQLASIAYRVVTSIDMGLSTPQLANRIRESSARGDRFDLPRLADILPTPAFAPLRAFLAERGIPIPDLQARIDAVVEQVRASVTAAPVPTTPQPSQPTAPQPPATPWPWLPDALRRAGLTPTSTRELPATATPDAPPSWVILATPSEALQKLFDLAPEVLVFCAPAALLKPDDLASAEALFAREPRVDPALALVITADPDAQARLGSVQPDARWYLCVPAETLRTATEPQGFLSDLIRAGLDSRRLFDCRLVAEGWQFFGREKELASLERDVLAGHCLGVFGLRKVGKTSLVRRLAERLRGDGPGIRRVLPIEADLLSTPMLRRNLDGLADVIGRALERALSRAEIQVPATHAHPLERLRATVEHVEREHRARVLLILDEYEVLLGARPLAKHDGVELLTWLRGLAQEHPRGFGFILVGRNARLVAPARIDEVDNPMYRFLRNAPLTGLAPDDCRRMAEKLGGRVGLRFEPDAIDVVLGETGGHPALARTLGDIVDASVPAAARIPAMVDAALVRRVLPRFSRAVDEDMRELVNAANDIDARATDYLAHLAHGVPWIGGQAEARIDDALVDYGILHSDTHAFRIGHLLTWLRENYGSPAEAAHG